MIFLSLGTNVGNRLKNLEKAISLIQNHEKINILLKSKVYVTSPMENFNQDNFLNQVIKIEADIKPTLLLTFIKNIEKNMGRIKTKKKYMPRIIDIDILTYNDLIINNDNLSIPHPKIKLRKFILKPWSDIASDYILVNCKSTVKDLLNNIYHLKDEVKEYN